MKFRYYAYAFASIAAIACAEPAAASAKEKGPDSVVARVNNEVLKQKELDQLISSVPPAQAKQLEEAGRKDLMIANFIDQWINDQVLKQAAAKSEIDKKPEIKKALESARKEVLKRAFVEAQIAPKVTDAALEKEYKELKAQLQEKLKDKSEFKIRHIFVASEAKAKQAIARLNKGEDFLKVARELSEDTQSAQDGGDLGYIIEGVVSEFDEPLKKLTPGQFTKTPIKTEKGYHVVKLDDKRKAKVPPFKDIEQNLRERLWTKTAQNLLKKLRDSAQVENNFEAK